MTSTSAQGELALPLPTLTAVRLVKQPATASAQG
jgi:hypothetical protein